MIATHLNHLLSQHASELFGRLEAQQLIDHVAKSLPTLTEGIIPDLLSLTTVHKVLQNLLREQVSIRDMRTILETLTEHASTTQNSLELTNVVRVALGRAITQQWFQDDEIIQVIGLSPALEGLMQQVMRNGGGLEPGLAEQLVNQAGEAIAYQESLGVTPVLLVDSALRLLLARYLRRHYRQLVVMSTVELVSDRPIRQTATLGD